MTKRRGGDTHPAWGSCGGGRGGRKCIYTVAASFHPHWLVRGHPHTQARTSAWGRGGLSDAVCMLRRQEAVTGGPKGREKTLKLDSNLSRSSNMRSPPSLLEPSQPLTAGRRSGVSPPRALPQADPQRSSGDVRSQWFRQLRSWGCGCVCRAVFQRSGACGEWGWW